MKRILFNRRSVAAAAAALIATALAILPASAQQSSQKSSATDEPTSTSGASSSSGESMSESPSTSGASTTTLSEKDRNFIQEAAQGGMAEVRMGELGQQKATSPEVKALAKTLQDDHQKANDELANIAKSKGMDIPSGLGPHESAISSLENKQGADFDRAFVHDAIRDHNKDIAAFERAANNLDDPDLKAFAQKTVPVLRNHLSTAEQASKSLGSEKSEKSER